jgi:WD40 repeat protein
MWAQGLPAGGERQLPTPQLRLDAGGPTAFVTSLAFSPDGATLYSAGWNKVVDAWIDDPKRPGRLLRDPAGTFRVPIGPGPQGSINAIAVSPDGGQLAVAGFGLVPGAGDWKHVGWILPNAGGLTPAMRLDRGTIYLFDTATRAVRQLRKHTVPVLALTFAQPQRGQSRSCLVSVAGGDHADGAWSLDVYAWDTIGADVPIAGTRLPYAAASQARPGVGAWHYGEKPKQLAVALATAQPDGLLRLWNVESNQIHSATDGPKNNSLALDGASTPKRLVTGSEGRLRLWSLPERADGAPRRIGEVALGGATPKAVALVSARKGAPLDRAAVVSHSSRDDQLRLQWIELKTFRALVGDLPLWKAQRRFPVLATSATGGRIAVGGNGQHDIWVKPIDDWLARSPTPAQRLHGAGAQFGYAAFARKNERVGLLLGTSAPKTIGATPRPPAAGDMLFDPREGTLGSDLAGWSASAPRLGDWRVDDDWSQAQKSPFVRVRHAGEPDRSVGLERGQELSAYALLPPAGDREEAVLAIAWHELGEPSLGLFGAKPQGDFRQFRQLTGHDERLTSLAFDAGGKLLVSAALDQSVCVWWLGDDYDTLGVRAALSQVAIERIDGGDTLIVVQGDAEKRLIPGDRVLGLVEAGELRRIGDPHEFYSAVRKYKPGQEVIVRCLRGPAPRSLDVALSAGQAIDHRLPLFSFYAQPRASQPRAGRPRQAAPRVDWIGWTPWGPYDVSDANVEDRIGWHFNPDDRGAPVRFAEASQYASLHWPGLLDDLLRHPDRPPTPPGPRLPELSIWVEESGHDAQFPDVAGRIHLTGSDATLHAALVGPFDQRLSEGVFWRIAASPERAMAPADRAAATWSASLDEVDFKRGGQELVVALRTREVPPRAVRLAATVDYRPGAPIIEDVLPAAASSDSQNAKLVFSARIRPSSRRHSRLRVTLVQTADGEVPIRHEWNWDSDGELAIAKDLELIEGQASEITLSATNADAAGRDEASETSRVVRIVHFQPPLKPRIDLIATANDGRQAEATEGRNVRRLVIHSPDFLLDGRIAAEAKLSMAGWRWDGEDDWRPFAGFVAGRKNEWLLHEPITPSKPLAAPHLHRLTCRAEAEGGTSAQFELEVEYLPLAPELRITSPVEGTRLRDDDGEQPREVALAAAWEPPAERQAFEIEVLRNDTPLADVKPRRDDRRGVLTVHVPVNEGPNDFVLRAFNAWGSETRTDARRVWLGGAPRIAGEVKAAKRSPEQPWVDLEFLVDSPSGEALTALVVGGAAVDHAGAQPVVGGETGHDRWHVIARRVPLETQGPNRIEVQARNACGWSPPAHCEVTLDLPPPPKATIDVAQPANGLPLAEPACRVAFTVRSPSRLVKVEVLRELGRQAATVFAADVARQSEQPSESGKGVEYALAVDTEVELPYEGSYILKVLAENVGGATTIERSVTYLVPPVRLVVESLEPLEPLEPLDGAEGGVALQAAPRGGRYVFAKPASSGVMRLRGSLVWANATSAASMAGASIEVRVNGYRQEAVGLGAVDAARKQSWQVRLCLDRDDNQVEIELVGLPRDQSDRRELLIACDAPNEDRRLYVLVIGVGSPNALETQADELKRQALVALGADLADIAGDRFRTPVFQQGWAAPPRVKTHFDRQQLLGYISHANEYIRSATKDRPRTDLFLLYFRGAVAMEESRQVSASDGPMAHGIDSSAIDNETLSKLFKATPGAQLVLFDVQGEQFRETADARHGSLRYVWLGKTGRPADASLLVAFEQAAKKATTLDEICREIESRRKQRFPGNDLRFEPQFPESFRKLVLLTGGREQGTE